MKTPEEIKKGLECCILETDDTSLVDHCRACPYQPTGLCFRTLLKDALEQLEAQVPKWISVEERLPKNEEPVLIATKWSLMGMRGMAVSCGFHTNGKTFTGDSDYNWESGNVDLLYDEEEDEYIVPECWWESVRYSDEFAAVDEPVLYWMPLPELPKEG